MEVFEVPRGAASYELSSGSGYVVRVMFVVGWLVDRELVLWGEI